MTPSKFDITSQVETCIREVESMLSTGVVQNGWPHEMFWPVLSTIVIYTRDMVAKSRLLANKPIDFTDDVIVEGSVKDAETLIKFMRDGLCHVESSNHKIDDTTRFSRNVVRGKGAGARINEYSATSDYDDDIAIFIGNQRAYVGRHIIRSFREAKANLDAYIKQLP